MGVLNTAASFMNFFIHLGAAASAEPLRVTGPVRFAECHDQEQRFGIRIFSSVLLPDFRPALEYGLMILNYTKIRNAKDGARNFHSFDRIGNNEYIWE